MKCLKMKLSCPSGQNLKSFQALHSVRYELLNLSTEQNPTSKEQIENEYYSQFRLQKTNKLEHF